MCYLLYSILLWFFNALSSTISLSLLQWAINHITFLVVDFNALSSQFLLAVKSNNTLFLVFYSTVVVFNALLYSSSSLAVVFNNALSLIFYSTVVALNNVLLILVPLSSYLFTTYYFSYSVFSAVAFIALSSMVCFNFLQWVINYITFLVVAQLQCIIFYILIYDNCFRQCTIFYILFLSSCTRQYIIIS